jgi:hypothetical protein
VSIWSDHAPAVAYSLTAAKTATFDTSMQVCCERILWASHHGSVPSTSQTVRQVLLTVMGYFSIYFWW